MTAGGAQSLAGGAQSPAGAGGGGDAKALTRARDGGDAPRRTPAQRARLFVALELPTVVRDELTRWRADIVRELRGLRAIAPEALHVTLCFLGSRPVEEIDQIASACETVAALPAAELSLGAPVWLPARRPRVLAVELVDREGALSQVQAALGRALEAGGWYEPEARPFLPHVSVARVGKGARTRAVAVAAPAPVTLLGSTITLYCSRLQPGGARYEPLRTIELGGGATEAACRSSPQAPARSPR